MRSFPTRKRVRGETRVHQCQIGLEFRRLECEKKKGKIYNITLGFPRVTYARIAHETLPDKSNSLLSKENSAEIIGFTFRSVKYSHN